MESFDKTVLKIFLCNVDEDMARPTSTEKLQRPDTLEQALELVLEEENFQMQYRFRHKPCNNNSIPKKPNYHQNSRPINQCNQYNRPRFIQPENLPQPIYNWKRAIKMID